MRVAVLSEISNNGCKMGKWALEAESYRDSQWSWLPRRAPTRQNLKVWRDCLRGTFMKGIDDLLDPVIGTLHNCIGNTAFTPFNYGAMTKGQTLMDTIRQYPLGLLSLLGES